MRHNLRAGPPRPMAWGVYGLHISVASSSLFFPKSVEKLRRADIHVAAVVGVDNIQISSLLTVPGSVVVTTVEEKDHVRPKMFVAALHMWEVHGIRRARKLNGHVRSSTAARAP